MLIQNVSAENKEICKIVDYHPKFTRRPDLSVQTRTHIAFTAYMAMLSCARAWGTITALANEFGISRTFVYQLASKCGEICTRIFGEREFNALPDGEKKRALSFILSLRLEGRCSIGSTSTILNRFQIKPGSEGAISQYMKHFGQMLPSTLTTNNDEIQYVIFLSDEIFSKRIPILVTVDSVSSAMLRIELADSRNADVWKMHWQCLEKNGYHTSYLVSDEGAGLRSAQKEVLSEIVWQPDTYHAIAHRLGQMVDTFFREASKAIEKEDACYKKLDSAKTNSVIVKRIDQFEKAERIANEKIELFDEYEYLYISLISELKIFDENGKTRDRKEAEGNIKAGLELVEALGQKRLTKRVNQIRKSLPDLLNYFDEAKSIVAGLEDLSIDQEALKALCIAWQWKKSQIKAKKADRRWRCASKERFCLEIATGYLQEDYDDVKEQVYERLDHIVQSSALVECINSIIRPYLDNSKNHVTQETLNLIMFYHNHRRFKAGKRKKKTPMEILTGKRQHKDWIEILFDIVEEKDPSFFASMR